MPMRRGFVYLAAVIGGFTRKVLAWRVSITLETAFCIEAVENAMARHGRPHSSLAEKTPDQAYFNQPKPIPVAAE